MENSNSTSGTRRIAKACLASCRKLLAQLQNIKRTILTEFRDGLGMNEHLLRLALNEAEALARQTPYPHLFFPELAMEKARSVRAWQARQQSVRTEHPWHRNEHRSLHAV